MERIGRYEIVRLVGRGGMGELYQARDTVLDREVAVKVMYADSVGDDHAHARFYREAKAVARLAHRNIVTIFEFNEEQGVPYIVMEFLRGHSLADALRRKVPLSLAARLGIVVDLCEGLHYAHQQGVVHRDVKPANIWLQPDGSVKLLDFGIAKFADGTFTRAGALVGSAAYMSPEQVGGHPAGPQSDVFSAGVVLYELVSGRRPFEAESITGIMMKIMQESARDIRTVVPDVPEAVAAVMDAALQKDPANRYADAAEMAADLRLARLEIDAAAEPAETERPTRRRTRLSDAPPPITPTDHGRDPAEETRHDHGRRPYADFEFRDDAPEPPRPEPLPSRRLGLSVAVAALLFALAGGGAYVFYRIPAGPSEAAAIGTAGKSPDGEAGQSLPQPPAVPQEPVPDPETPVADSVSKEPPVLPATEQVTPPAPEPPAPKPAPPALASLRILRSPAGYMTCQALVGGWKGYPFDGGEEVRVAPRRHAITIRCVGQEPIVGTIDVPSGRTSANFQDVIRLAASPDQPEPDPR